MQHTADFSFDEEFLRNRTYQRKKIVQVAYISKSTKKIDTALLAAIQQKSISYNKRHGLTGVLLAMGHTYFSMLEGVGSSVMKSIERISEDPEHDNLTIVMNREVAERSFPTKDLKIVEAEDEVVLKLLIDEMVGTKDQLLRASRADAILSIVEIALKDTCPKVATSPVASICSAAEASGLPVPKLANPLNADIERTPIASKPDLTWHLSEAIKHQSVAKRRLEAALDGGELGLYDWRIGTTDVYVNSHWLEMLGYSIEEYTPSFSVWRSLMHADDIEGAERSLTAYLSGEAEAYDIVVRMLAKEGDYRYIRCRGRICERDEHHQPIRLVGTHQDVTDEVKLRLNLEGLLEKSKGIIQEKVDFLAKMGHEIRTPLTGIMGLVSLLKEEDISQNTATYLNEIEFCAAHLRDIAEGVLYLAKEQSGTLPVKPAEIDIGDIISSTCASLAHPATQKGLTISHTVSGAEKGILISDQQRLTQIVYNLLNNAIKYSNAGSILIDVDVAHGQSKGSGMITLKVIDEGQGIAEAEKEQIFQKFHQIRDHGEQMVDGVGLGLSIVSEIVASLNGEINVESKAGVGTTFTVKLPTALRSIETDRERGEGTPHSDESASLDTVRLLVAEDNPINTRYITAVLENMGVTFELVDDGQKALDKAMAERFDILVLDVNMPEMSGPEVAEYIRKHQGPNQQAPIIALTANVFPDDIAFYEKAGMNHHLAKPFTPTGLKETFEKALGL